MFSKFYFSLAHSRLPTNHPELSIIRKSWAPAQSRRKCRTDVLNVIRVINKKWKWPSVLMRKITINSITSVSQTYYCINYRLSGYWPDLYRKGSFLIKRIRRHATCYWKLVEVPKWIWKWFPYYYLSWLKKLRLWNLSHRLYGSSRSSGFQCPL